MGLRLGGREALVEVSGGRNKTTIDQSLPPVKPTPYIPVPVVCVPNLKRQNDENFFNYLPTLQCVARSDG